MEEVRHDIRIPAELSGRRLDQALAELFPDYSRSRIKAWILGGHVALEGSLPTPRTRVTAGQRVEFAAVAEPQRSDEPEAMLLSVAYEDGEVLVVDKPAGLVVHPGAGQAAGTLINGLLARTPDLASLPRCGLVHRLDKDTSGLLLVAKTQRAHTRLVASLEARKIRREYRAVCAGSLTAGGEIAAPVGRHPNHRTRMAVTERGRPATTHYRVLARFPAHTFLAVRLETGRTHQIRVHFAHLRHPLLGDPVYGGRLRVPAGASPELAAVLRSFRRQALHAQALTFAHPQTGEPLSVRSSLPDDMRGLLATLAGSSAAGERFDELQWPEPKPSN